MHRFQLFPALRVLHELLLLLQHLGKAAGRFEVQGRFRRGLLLRLRSRAGVLCGEGLLCGAVILRRQVHSLRFLIQPCIQPALADAFFQPLERFFLFLVGQVGQHLQ